MSKYVLVSFVSFLLLFSSCRNEVTEQEKAEMLFLEAQQLYKENKFNSSKLLIDSIHKEYHRVIPVREKVRTLAFTIVYNEQQRNLVYFDSLLTLKQEEWESTLKAFRLSKDSAYLEEKLYLHKSKVYRYTPHTDLLPQVDELGKLTLISVYHSGRFFQHSFKVSNPEGFFVETLTIPKGNLNFHTFSDGQSSWEYLSFNEINQNGVVEFIAQYADEKLQITLQGRRNHVYYLEERTKKAIKEAHHFSVLTKDILLLKKQIKQSEIKISSIKQKINVP